MNVRVSGSVWSSLIFDNVRQEGDKEGFLIGEVSMQELTNISDSQMNKTTQETSVTVISHILCTKPFSFYNRKGQVQRERLQALLKSNYDNVVGWFRCRSGSIPELSLREITLHHHLRDIFGMPYSTFLFGLFGESSNTNHTTITYYYKFFAFNNGMFCPQKVTIENLGDTAESEYKHGSSSSTETGGSNSYKHILARHKNDMIDKDGYLQGMQGIRKTNEAVHQKMRSLKDSVVETEESVKRLVNEIKMLNRRAVQLQSQPTPKAAGDIKTEHPDATSPREALPAQEEMDRSEESDKMDTTEDSQVDATATTSEPQQEIKEEAIPDSSDPFSSLCQDMKASISPSVKSHSTFHNSRDKRKAQDKVGARERSTRNGDVSSSTSSVSGKGNSTGQSASSDNGSPAQKRPGDDFDSDTESDSTQLPDSQHELQLSGSQTF